MKALALLLVVSQLTACCFIDACANRQPVAVTPVEASDRPLPSLDTGGSGVVR